MVIDLPYEHVRNPSEGLFFCISQVTPTPKIPTICSQLSFGQDSRLSWHILVDMSNVSILLVLSNRSFFCIILTSLVLLSFFKLLGWPNPWGTEVRQRSIWFQDLVCAFPHWCSHNFANRLKEEADIWIEIPWRTNRLYLVKGLEDFFIMTSLQIGVAAGRIEVTALHFPVPDSQWRRHFQVTDRFAWGNHKGWEVFHTVFFALFLY